MGPPATSPSAPDPRRLRLRVGLGAAVVLVLVGLAVAVAAALLGPTGATAVVDASPDPSAYPSGRPSASAAPRADPSPSADTVYVHVLGAVARPGLYRLAAGARVVDAVAAAGGFSDVADPGTVNLARPLTDGEQLTVGVPGAPPPTASGAATPGGKVNLNTADAATLETLPRVGPAMAQRILDWRTANGRFTSVEDLLGVTGIGDKTFADLKDLVTV